MRELSACPQHQPSSTAHANIRLHPPPCPCPELRYRLSQATLQTTPAKCSSAQLRAEMHRCTDAPKKALDRSRGGTSLLEAPSSSGCAAGQLLTPHTPLPTHHFRSITGWAKSARARARARAPDARAGAGGHGEISARSDSTDTVSRFWGNATTRQEAELLARARSRLNVGIPRAAWLLHTKEPTTTPGSYARAAAGRRWQGGGHCARRATRNSPFGHGVPMDTSTGRSRERGRRVEPSDLES